MNLPKKLPIGIEDFEEIRTEGFYYVDKTGFIKELLNNWSKVNLFTRPRRFGKSLNMNMLKCFFEYGHDSRLFDGLAISAEKELCEKYLGKFPVISITFKSVNARDYETARNMLCSIIGNEALRFQSLLESTILSKEEKMRFQQLIGAGKTGQPGFLMTDDVLMNSLYVLASLLKRHYGAKIILLIDEYDVPLDKAEHSGYYAEMASLMQNLLGQALKGNDSLYFAVLTGCLRISKESIFTGLNNLAVKSITDMEYDEYFGFSEKEVQEMLQFYGVGHQHDLARKWYNGYHFGNADVYCPWDIVNYCAMLRSNPNAAPKAFWKNTSGNEIIRNFLERSTLKTRIELEELVAGGSVHKKINQELTYRDLYKNLNNLWSVLFLTGYLTQCGQAEKDMYELKIPNLEIREIFIEQIFEWFQEEVRKDTPKLDTFCRAFQNADPEMAEQQFNAYLQKTISIRDTGSRKVKKENFYHGILLGLLSHREDWNIDSNAESGEGFSDILVENLEKSIGIVIEIKYPDNGDLESGCTDALNQIEEKGYESKLRQDGMETVLKYGIACYKKRCQIRLGRPE